MKKLFALLSIVCLFAVSAQAQFRTSGVTKVDLLNGTPLVLAASGVTNLTVPAYIGKDGFAITPYFVGTNSGSATLGIGYVKASDGNKNTDAVALLGAVAMNGTTPVRSSLMISGTNYGVGLVYLTVTNNHSASLIISNISVTAW